MEAPLITKTFSERRWWWAVWHNGICVGKYSEKIMAELKVRDLRRLRYKFVTHQLYDKLSAILGASDPITLMALELIPLEKDAMKLAYEYGQTDFFEDVNDYMTKYYEPIPE